MEILKKLVDAPGISGAENSVRDVIAKELKPYVDDIKIDKVGNLIARKGSGKPKIMLVAHMDQLGLMVKYINEKGFMRFEQMGGWDDRLIPGLKVNIWGRNGPVPGVIGAKPIHIQEKEEQKQPIKPEDMYIDIGATSSKEVEQTGIEIGSFVSIAGQLTKLVGSRTTGPGFDNKIGCTVLIEAVKRLKGFKGTLYAVSSVQEEIGLIGVRGAIFGIEPDVIIGVDTTIAGDTPQIKTDELPVYLGRGPVLILRDAISVINPNTKKWLADTAKSLKINLQYEVTKAGATDASIAPIMREGIPSASLCVATRYIHTPVELADTKDIESAIRMVVGAIGTASKYF